MATETRTFYPGAYDSGASSVQSVTNATNPVGKGSTNTTYATINLVTGSGATTTIYWPFDLSAIPSNAAIDSVECSVKAIRPPDSFATVGTAQLFTGGTSKGSATAMPTSSTSGIMSLSTGSWTREELRDCRLKLYAKRATNNQTKSCSIMFYGADLTVAYTYNTEKFLVKLNGSWAGAASVYKKVNGVWVEQTDLANLMSGSVRYKNAGEYVPPTKTVTITGSGNTFGCYITVNGVKYTSAATLEVDTGTVISATVGAGYYGGTLTVVLNGTTVQNGAGTYNHTVNAPCTINLAYNAYYGSTSITITITTS